MVTVTIQGRDFDAVNFHEVDIMSYFPEGEPSVNGVIKCLSDVFNSEEADALMDRMTVEEIMTLWEEWSRQSNFEFVYKRVYDVVKDDRDRKLRLGFWLLGSWLVTGVVAIVALVLLVT